MDDGDVNSSEHHDRMNLTKLFYRIFVQHRTSTQEMALS